MIERCFVGRERPLLAETVRLLLGRHAVGGGWDMSRVLIVLPGAQAARRLERMLYDAAGLAPGQPEIVTPAALLERLYTPPLKIADALTSSFAWVQAASTLNTDTLQVRGGAREAQRARSAASAERLTLAQIAERCAGLPGVCDDARWSALAHLESAYLKTLADAGLCDRDDARLAALASQAIRCGKDIYLIGTQDLNGLEKALLSALTSPVAAVIPAPKSEKDKFDAAGGLRVDAWHDTLHPIPDELVEFVDGPGGETEAITAHLAALNGAFALEEITVGVGDEAAAESLARRLAVRGLPSFSPFGRPMSRVRPFALLGAARDYLHAPGPRTFAALVRHPDLELWLAAEQGLEELPLLTHLDRYRAECLPDALPAGESADGGVQKAACDKVASAAASVHTLLGGLQEGRKKMTGWAEPTAALLERIYGRTPLTEDPEGRQLARSLSRMREILRGLKHLPPALAPTVSGAEALAFVLDQVENERLPSEPDCGAGMELRGWLELALDDAPVLLLTGLLEGCVPNGSGDDALLPDSLRQTLGLADDRRRAVRDSFLLRQMIETRQSEGRYVRIIVSRRGADGAPRLPSRLLFGGTPEEAARRIGRYVDRTSRAASVRPLFTAGGSRALVSARPAAPHSPINEMSVSGFAAYLACPYRFYLRHVLKLEEQDDSKSEMDARRFGPLLHDCLRAFAKWGPVESLDPAEIRHYLREQLVRQSERQFGVSPSAVLQMQIRQAGRRLDAFALWQAESARDGWIIQDDFSEKELTAVLVVEGQDFVVRGKLDRVDYHGGSDTYRVIDYKTGDAGKGPEEKHRVSQPEENGTLWAELQLPLYRILLSQNGVSLDQLPPGELGYVLLSADLERVRSAGKRTGGTGFIAPSWAQADHDSALGCAAEIIQKVRAGVFWPPADPSPFPSSRTDPGAADVYGGLCLDSCTDRADWFTS